MTELNKQAMTDEAISQAFTGTNFGRDDLKNILAETVIDAAAGWCCGYTATTICTQLGLLTATGRASALGLRFVSEHVQRETKRLKDELEAAAKRIAELEARGITVEPFRSFVTDDDLAALHRFAECCDDPESGGHDLEKEQVRRLEAIGALQRSGRISYITGFGDVLISITAGIGVKGE
ncbi:TPA: hypothetical protein U2J22_004584 [Citrobacter youngae]|nr:hypothetical protein [Citrobacter youngae]